VECEGEAEVLATFAEQDVEPATVKEIVNWRTGHFNNALGDPANVENIVALESEFRTIAKPHVLDDGLVNALVKWQRGRIGGGGE
jgi:hypothetical protein